LYALTDDADITRRSEDIPETNRSGQVDMRHNANHNLVRSNSREQAQLAGDDFETDILNNGGNCGQGGGDIREEVK